MTPPFANAGAAAPTEPSAPGTARIPAPSGIESIDRIFRDLHPVAERYLRGEATEEELLQVPEMGEDSGATIEETLAWLRGEGPGCDRTG